MSNQQREDSLDCKLSGQNKVDRLIDGAAALIAGQAYELMLSHAISGEWPASEAHIKAEHDMLLEMVGELRELKGSCSEKPNNSDHIADASKMVPNLSRIAQKKLEQMGATVHGLLVKNEAGAWAAVSEAGRVMWLDDFEAEAEPAQGGQGSEVAVVELSDLIHLSGAAVSQRKALKEVSEGSIQNLPVGTKLYTHPQPAQQGMPEGWRECLAEMVQAMHDYEMNVDEVAPYKHRAMMGRAHALLSTPTTPQPEGDGRIEPDILWDADNPEDSGQDSAYELADYCSSDMPVDETMVVDVMCAKRLPNRKMKIWIDENEDLQWEWVAPQPPQEGQGDE